MKTTSLFKYILRLAASCLLLLCMAQPGAAQSFPQTKLLANDGGEDAYFGQAVALDGDWALVGGYLDDERGFQAGAAYLYQRQPDETWLQKTKLTASDSQERDFFGVSVAISGDRAVVGANGVDGTRTLQVGGAYVFEKQPDDSWIEVAKLNPSALDRDVDFGAAVSISGDRIIVGSPDDRDVDFLAGAAYVFTREPDGTWSQEAKLTASDGEIFDGFGVSASLSGDRALIGVDYPSDHHGGYVFERQPDGTWLETAKLVSGDIDENIDDFSSALSLDGDRALIGAARDGDNGVESGSAYIFEYQSNGSWLETAKLKASDGHDFQRFALSVSLDGNRALIGARGDDDMGESAEASYLFDRQPDGSWLEVAKLTAGDGMEGDLFGTSVAMAGNLAIAGAQTEDTNGNQAGAGLCIRSDHGSHQLHPHRRGHGLASVRVRSAIGRRIRRYRHTALAQLERTRKRDRNG